MFDVRLRSSWRRCWRFVLAIATSAGAPLGHVACPAHACNVLLVAGLYSIARHSSTLVITSFLAYSSAATLWPTWPHAQTWLLFVIAPALVSS